MRARILLTDDQNMVRQGVRALLEREGFDVVGEAADGREAVRLAQELLPEVAILDLAMPKLNGLDAAREILRASPQTHVVFLTMHTEAHQIVTALQVGVRGYVAKARAAEELVRAIREVSGGGIYLCPIATRVFIEANLPKINRPLPLDRPGTTGPQHPE